jgi:two-component system sensor histidine kinase SenX3
VDVALALLAGVVIGALFAVAALVRVRRSSAAAGEHPVVPPTVLSEDLARRSLETLRAALVVVDPSDEVVLANPAAQRMGVVRDRRISHGTLRTLARQARSGLDTGETVRDTELDLPRGRMLDPLAVRVRVAALGLGGHVVLQVEDVTEVHRVAKVRRDFVANVSHELKTPVGALQLLAEAVADATDDPEAVRRFSARMQHESERLGRLVHEIIQLSRLQGAEPLPEPEAVSVDRVVAEVLDRSRSTADARRIAVVTGGERGLAVSGSESQLITALGNLVDNAIAYSPEGTRVAIGIRQRDSLVEVSVSDQGMGIAEPDLDRIFERFYRADPARSRATGGTGLGLAIVKHIATNHGGSVDVWSVEGSGSTFTLRLPARPRTQADVTTVDLPEAPESAPLDPLTQRGNA